MKIIGYSASPRKKGNTVFIVDKILEGARERGAVTQAFHYSGLKVEPCRGCLGCQQGGGQGCVVKDDMQGLYEALQSADALVLGSPVYMGQMSAQAKIFTDRLFAWIHPRFSPDFREQYAGKKLVLSFNQGNPNPELFRQYFAYTKSMFEMLEFEVKKLHVVTGMRTEAACDKKELHTDMKAIGAALVV